MLNSQILKEMKVTDDLQPNQALDLITKNNGNLVILDVTTGFNLSHSRDYLPGIQHRRNRLPLCAPEARHRHGFG